MATQTYMINKKENKSEIIIKDMQGKSIRKIYFRNIKMELKIMWENIKNWIKRIVRTWKFNREPDVV